MAYNHEKGMCYVLKEKGVCFIPIPKNASTTIRRELFGNNVDEVTDNFIKNPRVLEENKVIAVIREPIDRFCSAYLEILIRTHDCPLTLEKDFYHIQEEPLRFLEFIKEARRGFYDAHIEPQLFYLTDLNSKLVKIDEVWEMKDVKRHIQENFAGKKAGQHNFKRIEEKNEYKSFLNTHPKVKQLIEGLYREDIEFYIKQTSKE